MVEELYALDWYTNKNFRVTNITPEILGTLKYKQKIVYQVHDQDKKETFFSIGECLLHDVKTDHEVVFKKILNDEDHTYFIRMQDFAQQWYPTFKKEFRKNFPGSIPITARFQIYTNQLYFYFYAQERYNFSEYAKQLKKRIGKNIFFYQVSPRDMIRMCPAFDAIIGYNGISLCEKSTRDLPEVTMDDIIIQNLEGRDIERLKSRNGKFKPSLGYEIEIYREESKKYPPKGSYVIDEKNNISGIVVSYNIMNGEVKIKNENGDIFFVHYTQLKTQQTKT